MDQKTVYPVVKSLLEKKAVLIEEELKERYKPKYDSFIRLSTEYSNEEKLQIAFDELQRAPKQLELLMRYVELSNLFGNSKREVRKVNLQKSANANSSQVNQLVKKGIVEIYQKEVGRLQLDELETNSLLNLNEEQENALNTINKILDEKRVCLLHGVTGSGKTEVYVRKIKEVIEQGGKALYLVPEIALTTQLIHRLKRYFGNRVGVYHSKFNAQERVEIRSRF